MKKLNYTFIVAACICVFSVTVKAQKNKLLLGLSYDNVNNKMQYLEAHAKSKINGKLTLVPGLQLKFYITSDSPANLLGKAITDEQGNAYVQIPAIAKTEWDKTTKPGFVVDVDETSSFYAASASFDLTKARLKIDTSDDKKIIATLTELKDSSWAPVKGVDIKIAVKRLSGDLNVNETQSFSTDSLGMASADFKRDNLPGDEKGNLILVAKVEDNDTYGNLSTEKSVHWGVPAKYQQNFNERTLFARRGRSPIWLEFIAYSIIAGVWGVLLYLAWQIRMLKRLGATET